jgi:CelD/BcsL family acetyltransferase involved in cellulose biosynthesis
MESHARSPQGRLLNMLEKQGRNVIGNDNVTIDTVSDKCDFAGLEREWDKLNESAPFSTPFTSFGWLYSWWDVFGYKNKLLILLARRNGRLVAIMPGMIEKVTFARAAAIRRISFIGKGLSDYSSIIGAAEDEIVVDRMMSAIKSLGKWDTISLGRLPASNPGTEVLFRSISRHFAYSRRTDEGGCPILNISGQYDDYFATYLSKESRRMLRRKERNIREVGNVCFEVITAPDECIKILPKCLDMHTHRWTINSGTNSYGAKKYDSHETRQFIENATNRIAKSGNVEIAVIKLNSKILAYLYSLKQGKKLWQWSTSFESELSRYSPGELIRFYVVRDAFFRSMEVVNFGGGVTDHEYKLRWTREIEGRSELSGVNMRSIIGRVSDKYIKVRLAVRLRTK